jgi:hypothetical protein
MASPTYPRHPSGGAKLFLCALAGLVTGAVLLRAGRWVVGPWAPYAGLLAGAVLVLVGAISYGVYWGRQPAGRLADRPILACWHGVLRYAEAFDLSLIGWQKIFNLLFFVPLGMLDLPFSSFSGEDLTVGAGWLGANLYRGRHRERASATGAAGRGLCTHGAGTWSIAADPAVGTRIATRLIPS